MCVCANGIVVCNTKGDRCAAFPRLYSARDRGRVPDRLRSIVRTAVYDVAHEAHREAQRTKGEVGGDLLARTVRRTGRWQVDAILCLNGNSTELRSDPSCKRTIPRHA